MMMKRFNIQGIIILVVVLAVIQVGVGLFVSPFLGKFVIEKINDASNARISIDKVHVWPVTLSVSLKGLAVFNPDSDNERIVNIGSASVRLSPVAMLSKRLVLSSVTLNDVDITLEGEPDGSFNIQKLGQPKEEEKKPFRVSGVLDRFKKKKDWYGRVYDMLKKRSSKEAVEEQKSSRQAAGKVTREVTELPRGRRVTFTTVRDDYLFAITKMKVNNGRIRMIADDGETADVDRANIVMSGLAVDPKKGTRFDKLFLNGILKKKEKEAGNFDISYRQAFKKNDLVTDIDVKARGIDLAAIGFIYDDSLPVIVKSGRLDIQSKTRMLNDGLDSHNYLVLKDPKLEPKSGRQAVGLVPMPMICQALNSINPVKLKFDITGTVENPQFSGFQDVLLELVKPAMKDLEEQGIKAGVDFLKKKAGIGGTESGAQNEEDAAEKTLDSIKSLFSGQEKK